MISARYVRSASQITWCYRQKRQSMKASQQIQFSSTMDHHPRVLHVRCSLDDVYIIFMYHIDDEKLDKADKLPGWTC